MKDPNVERLPKLLIIFVEQTQKSESFGDPVPTSEQSYQKRQVPTFAIEVEIEKNFGTFHHRITSSVIKSENKSCKTMIEKFELLLRRLFFVHYLFGSKHNLKLLEALTGCCFKYNNHANGWVNIDEWCAYKIQLHGGN